MPNTDKEIEAVNLGEVVYVLRLAGDGKLSEASDWTTDGFASAVWNGFITKDDAMTLTLAGEGFLAKVSALYPDNTADKRHYGVCQEHTVMARATVCCVLNRGHAGDHEWPVDSSSNVQYDTGYDDNRVREPLDQAGSQAGAGTGSARPVETVGPARNAERSAGMVADGLLRARDRRGRGAELQGLNEPHSPDYVSDAEVIRSLSGGPVMCVVQIIVDDLAWGRPESAPGMPAEHPFRGHDGAPCLFHVGVGTSGYCDRPESDPVHGPEAEQG